MTKDKFSLPDCPLEYVANIIGGKWKIRLIWALYESEYVIFYIYYNTDKYTILYFIIVNINLLRTCKI